MELSEKLQQLRKKKGLTQEELAQALYVSRTAVSKWESGRGYPNIDSLKAIAKYFGVTIDELLSGGEMLSIAEEDSREKETLMRGRIYALLDISSLLFLLLPLFGWEQDGTIRTASLLSLDGIAPYLRAAYFAFVIAVVVTGMLSLVLSAGARQQQWQRMSLMLSAAGVLLFMVSRQPYAAVIVFAFLMIKAFMLLKKP